MSKEETTPRIPPAIPGHICVLLEPDAVEIPGLRELQTSLQTHFGGKFHQRIHFTCQRFVIDKKTSLGTLIERLENDLAWIRPFPVTAESLVMLEPPFWQMRMLRWVVSAPEELWNLGCAMNRALVETGAKPFYLGEDWKPTTITALEDIPDKDVSGYLETAPFPLYLFTVRNVILSEIVGRGQFEILKTVRLTDG